MVTVLCATNLQHVILSTPMFSCNVPSPLTQPRSLTEEIEWLLSTPSVRETENKKMGAEVSHRAPYLRYTASIPLVTLHYIVILPVYP